MRWVIAALTAAAAIAAFAGEAARPSLSHRWLYVQTNLQVNENVEKLTALMERASKAGYNGVALADSKFMRWGDVPARYLDNARKVREASRKANLALIACVFPIGWSNDLLSRDPNLAEGLPVVDAPFVVRNGKLVPADDGAKITNGGFEQFKGNTPTGWGFVDKPGAMSFMIMVPSAEGADSIRGTRSPARSTASSDSLMPSGMSVGFLSGLAFFQAARTLPLTAARSPSGISTFWPRNPLPRAAQAAPTMPGSGSPPGLAVRRNFQLPGASDGV